MKSRAGTGGKTVSLYERGSSQEIFLASMMAYVGLDPRKDVSWVVQRRAQMMSELEAGRIDAFLAFPPDAQELRAKKIGHVVVNSTTDRPWSQYFCCMLAANHEFVRKHPVATKRALRAMLKAVAVCAQEAQRVARFLVDNGFTSRYDYALETLEEIPYAQWRGYDPEDTLRFYALRLHEAGMIKSSPQKILARGTDWRFLEELSTQLRT